MSRQTSFYINSLLVLALASLVISYLARPAPNVVDNATKVQPVFASKGDMSGPIAQKTDKRNWQPMSLQKTLVIDSLKDPGEVKVDAEDNIYIIDWSDLQIRKFSETGQLLALLGKGKGNKLGQFINPTDFALTDKGEVLVADPKRKDVTVFNSLGEAKTISPKTSVMRVTSAGANGFIAMSTPNVEHLFETYNESGEFLKSFGHLIDQQSYNAISLAGWIAADGADKFVYAGSYAGFLASFKTNGELQFFAQTIDAYPIPKILVMPDGTRKVDHQEAPISAYSVSIAGDEIYLLSGKRPDIANRQIIDVYNKHDGSYLYSSEAPEPCERLCVTGNYLLTANGKTVTKWLRSR